MMQNCGADYQLLQENRRRLLRSFVTSWPSSLLASRFGLATLKHSAIESGGQSTTSCVAAVSRQKGRMRLSANRTCVSRSSTAPLARSCGLRAVTCERHTARPPSLPGNRWICSLAACLPIFSAERRRIWILSEVSRRAARVHKRDKTGSGTVRRDRPRASERRKPRASGTRARIGRGSQGTEGNYYLPSRQYARSDQIEN